MDIDKCYSFTATQDDCIVVDISFNDGEITKRIDYYYRASDVYSPLTPLITQWIADNNPVILPYEPPPASTPEEIRADMPDKTPREFRDILIDEGILTDANPDEVTLAIQEIPYDIERAKALNAWQNPTMFSRSDPYIDMIGAMFGLTPEDIDRLWNEN